jgi:hypothetical protein
VTPLARWHTAVVGPVEPDVERRAPARRSSRRRNRRDHPPPRRPDLLRRESCGWCFGWPTASPAPASPTGASRRPWHEKSPNPDRRRWRSAAGSTPPQNRRWPPPSRWRPPRWTRWCAPRTARESEPWSTGARPSSKHAETELLRWHYQHVLPLGSSSATPRSTPPVTAVQRVRPFTGRTLPPG